jgi:hypothetical protein
MLSILLKLLRPNTYWHEIETKAPTWKWTLTRVMVPLFILYALTSSVAVMLFGAPGRATIWRSFLSVIGTIAFGFLFLFIETGIMRFISKRGGGDSSRSVAFTVISYSSIPVLIWSILEPLLEPIIIYATPFGIVIRAYVLVLLYCGIVVLAKVPGNVPKRVALTLLVPGIPVAISVAVIGIGTLLKSALVP